MRILVTGGAGFIGSHLCEALVQQGNQVTVLDDLSTGRFENIEHIPGLTSVIDSTLNKEIVRDLVREADVVYHLAATVGVQLVVDQPVRTLVNNIRGTENILEETSRYQQRSVRKGHESRIPRRRRPRDGRDVAQPVGVCRVQGHG